MLPGPKPDIRIYSMILLVVVLACAAAVPAQELPFAGLAGAGVMTSSLEEARQFYGSTLGFPEAVALKDERGRVVSIFFNVNEDQHIQVFAGLTPQQAPRMTHVAVRTTDVAGLRKLLLKRGVIPGPVGKQPDGTLACSMRDPDGTRLVFVEITPDSLHVKFNSKLPSDLRVSRHLWHVGVLAGNADTSLGFYRDKFGLSEVWRGGPRDGDLRWIQIRMPGEPGDGLELMLYSEAPAADQYGSMQHLCLEVADVKAAVETLVERGVTKKLQPRIGRNGRWTVNLTDPDGTRIELMERRQAR